MNTTVSQLAKSVSVVLTSAYRDIYGFDDDVLEPATLHLLTAPLAATEELINLHAAGLAPVEIVMPAALHAIGASKDEIDLAVKKAMQDEENRCKCDDDNRAVSQQDKQLALQEKKQPLEAEQAAANERPDEQKTVGQATKEK